MPLFRSSVRPKVFVAVLFTVVVLVWLLHSSRSGVLSSVPATQKTALTKHVRPDFEPAHERALVIAATRDEDIRWTRSWANDTTIKLFVYIVDDPDAVNRVPQNKGHEAMVYLTYIIDQYNHLADVSIFMHATRWSWHNEEFLFGDSIQMVSRLNTAKVLRDGYMNLRCRQKPGCPAHIHPFTDDFDLTMRPEEPYVFEAWEYMFPDIAVPEVLSQPCCSQFAVSSESIRSRPLVQYIRLREWLINTPIKDRIVGRIWEYIWQYLFTDEYIFCPDELVCYCEGYNTCFIDEAEKDDWYAVYEEFLSVRAKGTGLTGVGEPALPRKKAYGDAMLELEHQLDERRDAVFARRAKDNST